MSEQTKGLVAQRGQVKAQMTRFKTFLTDLGASYDLLEVQVRLEKIEKLWDRFSEIQDKIDEDDPDNELQLSERESFETEYFKLNALARAKLTAIPRAQNQEMAHAIDTKLNVKLPIIHLPTFDGAYDQWLTFHDTFNSLIHINQNLSDIQKFHYLRSSLKGDAARVIQSLGVSDSNYAIAWDLLKRRFENKQLIIHNHVTALFELPIINKESAQALRQMWDNTQNHLRALKALGQPTEHWDTLLIHVLATKFDTSTKREWQMKITASQDEPTINILSEFVATRCQILEALSSSASTLSTRPQGSTNQYSYSSQRNRMPNRFESSVVHVATNKPSCPICKSSHFLYHCETFKQLSVPSRIKAARKHKLCLNCFKTGHLTKDCLNGVCKKCSQKHNTLLHLEENQINQVQLSQPSIETALSTSSPDHTITTHSSRSIQPGVILATAIVQVVDQAGNLHKAKALLDGGSQSNFITRELCDKLKLRCTKTRSPVSGINQSLTYVSEKTELNIKSQYNGFKAEISCLVLPTITEKPPLVPLDPSWFRISTNINLADPDFGKSSTVDILIGSSLFWELLCIGQIKVANNLPILQKTKLGWVIAGPMTILPQKQPQRTICNLVTNETLQNQLTKFWSLEECSMKTTHLSDEEIACENHFTETTTRDSNGRFVVSIPFKDNLNDLGDSYKSAEKRLFYMERKLNKNPQLKTQYVQFMTEYQELNHMEEVKDMDTDTPLTFYLPHHPVFKESSSTTKLRVVFDGSAKTSSGLSLNDTQMIGPTVQNDLFSIINRFRQYTFVMTADVKKMYRQVRVREEHTHLQRILWRHDESQPIKIFKFNTVTYGTASAPFLAIRCL